MCCCGSAPGASANLDSPGSTAHIRQMIAASHNQFAQDHTTGGWRAALGLTQASGGALVMGILNVTPDSFSDGGEFTTADRALAHARAMIAQGADIIDIGAQSTRPYGDPQPVSAEEEIARLSPVLAPIVSLGVPVSIDTMKAEIAAWALAEGARMVNDVWGLQRDPRMAQCVARSGAPVIAMHNRDTADASLDIMTDIAAFFTRTLEIAERAGIARDQIILDPGIGFGKTPEQSLTVLARLSDLKRFGCALMVGASRKRFISSVARAEPQQRLGGSLAAHVIAAQAGADIVRVHDVGESVQALRVAAAIANRA